jgi:hypothetical protein
MQKETYTRIYLQKKKKKRHQKYITYSDLPIIFLLKTESVAM